MTSALLATSIRARIGELEVLRGIDLQVEFGTVVGLLGPSGAGKSTLFRVLAGEQPAPGASVRIAGVEVTGLPLWRRARAGLGYVPQTPSVLFDLSVRDNISSFQRASGQRFAAVEQLAGTVDLDQRLGVRARDLSGGERRRLEILRALIGKPRILLCDEPFAALDPASAHSMGRLLRGIAEAGSAVLLADHRVGDALSICDRAALLVDGRVELDVPASAFEQDAAVRQRYLA